MQKTNTVEKQYEDYMGWRAEMQSNTGDGKSLFQ